MTCILKPGLIFIVLPLLAACSSDPAEESAPPNASAPNAAEQVEQLLTGRFDSSAQAAMNPTFYAVQLVTCPAVAPELGPRVLYVEQALVDQPSAPYRQRLYVIEPGPESTVDAVSRVFELVDPGAYVGRCDQGEPLSVVAAEAVERQGCRVELTAVEERFEGSTPGNECLSDFQGASYATSEVTLFETHIVSWDRGFDDEGEQVWGATAGGYVFDRKTPLVGTSSGESSP
ncbi:MAG: chromophore lyase CpcT/CpeT [Deltaproteobacteria bacterium]|jgi:hypothetical protein|nr:chromophore lyase CpcT/CpeT [Deltaproteobacteria bacterium]MBW2532615.1 chromophore lyase CpcT/CpeT [Deltaproteobacteria bacterium]